MVVGRRRAVAALVAALALAGLFSGHAYASAAVDTQQRRSLHAAKAAADASATASGVTISNICPSTIAFKAAYNKPDNAACGEGHEEVLVDAEMSLYRCYTPWLVVEPSEEVDVAVADPAYFDWTAQVNASSPVFSISRMTPEAYLAQPANNSQRCPRANSSECVWWAMASAEPGAVLEMGCGDYKPGQPVTQETWPVEVINECGYPINFKAAYDMTDEDTGYGCSIIRDLTPTEQLCVTEVQRIEAGEQRYLAASTDFNWVWWASLVDNPSYVLSQWADDTFQAGNDTLACPEPELGLPCEWWAPSFPLMGDPARNGTDGPVVISCENYDPKKYPLPKK